MATTREILAGRAAVEISLRDKLKAGLDAAQGRLQKFAMSVAAIGISFNTVQALASNAMGIIGNVFTGPADQIQNLTDRTGLSVEMLQALAESGADSGATLEDVGGAARAMANFLQQAERGGDGAAKTLADLGMSAESLAGMSQDQRLSAFADALAGIDDPARRAALAQDIFGRGAMSLLPILGGGSKAMEAYKKRLQEIGALRTPEQIAAADELGDAFGRLSRRLSSVGVSAIAAIAPVLQKITDAAVGVVEVFNQWVVQNQELATALGLVGIAAIAGALAVAGLTTAVLLSAAVATAATTIWGVATAAVGAFTAVMAVVATPIGAVVAIAVALGVALAALAVTLLFTTDTGKLMVDGMIAGFAKLLAFTKQVFGGIFDALAAGNLGLAGQIAMAGLDVAWKYGWGLIKTTTVDALTWLGTTMVDMFSVIIDGLISAWNALAEQIGGTPIEFNAANLITGMEGISDGVRAEAEKATADAQAELDKLTGQAADEKKKREDSLRVPKQDKGEKDDDEEKKKKKPDIAEHLAKQIGSGTFSATSVGGLAQSTRTEKIWGDMVDLQKAADKHLEEVAKSLEEIKKKMDEGKMLVGS